MKFNKKITVTASLFMSLSLSSVHASAELKFVQSQGDKIVEVASAKVKETCGTNFVFREANKAEAPDYLSKEIVKAAFTSQMAPSLEALVGTLKASKGKCAWVTPDELPKVK